MEFKPIFAEESANTSDGLFAVLYNGSNQDVFSELIENWLDVEYLYDYFDENQEKLKAEYFKNGEITIANAVSNTREEAYHLFEKLEELSSNKNLHKVFFNLHKEQKDNENLIQKKARSNQNFKWLRIYAIKISDSTYLITGGGIKLVKSMSDCKHLAKELEKIKRVKKFLVENDIAFQEDFDSYLSID